MTDVVGAELNLISIFGGSRWESHNTGIAYQNVESWLSTGCERGEECLGARFDGCEGGEVDLEERYGDGGIVGFEVRDESISSGG